MCLQAAGNNQVEKRSDAGGEVGAVPGVKTLVSEKAWDNPQKERWGWDVVAEVGSSLLSASIFSENQKQEH